MGSRDNLPLAPILRSRDSSAEVASALDLLSKTEELLGRGIPGEPVFPLDQPLMELDPSRRFYSQEVVAWRNGAGHPYYGQIVVGEATVKSVNTTNLQKYKVDVGGGCVQVLRKHTC